MYPEIRASAEAIAHETLTALRAPLLSRRFQGAVAAAPQPVKVNIGAGNVHLDRWINTDVCPLSWPPLGLSASVAARPARAMIQCSAASSTATSPRKRPRS
jgi:hypothetical protein